MSRSKVFVSYCHKDMPWLRRVREHLDVLYQEGVLEYFDDLKIGVGANWYERIDAEMREAHVALLLISPSFLASNFICKVEIPLLFERHHQEGLVLYPLLIRDCPWQEVAWLSRMQIRPADAKPLATMRSPSVDSCLAAVAREITSITKRSLTVYVGSASTVAPIFDPTEPLLGHWGEIQKELLSSLVNRLSSKKATPTGEREATENAHKEWTRVDWKRAAGEYRTRVLEQVSTTRLLGNPNLITVDKTYVDVLVFDKGNAIRRSAISENYQFSNPYEVEDAKTRRPAEELVRTGKNLYILGRPGAGKTTFLKHLAMLACSGHLSQTPVFILLREYAESTKDLLSYIVSQFGACRFPDSKMFVEHLLESGRALILFDGLDEVNEEDAARSTLIRKLTAFSRAFPKSQVCVTCRIAATEYSFEQFQYLEVADFSPAQQREFISRWYEEEPDKTPRIMSEWELESSKPFRDLARTPLLLALICLAYDEIQHLPRRLVDLYSDALDVLLKKWDKSRNISRDSFYKDLTLSRRTQLLEEIAARNFSNDQVVFRTRTLVTQIARWYGTLPGVQELDRDGAEAILNALEVQHGLLVHRASDLHSFSHLSFQEFFTAHAVVHGHPEVSAEDLIEKRLSDERWREVFLFAVGLLPEASRFLRLMRAQVGRILREAEGAFEFVSFVAENVSSTDDAAKNFLHTARGQSKRSLLPYELQKSDEHFHVMLELIDEMSVSDGAIVKKLQFARECLSFEPYFISDRHRGTRYQFLDYLYSLRLLLECVSAAAIPDRSHFVNIVFTPES